MGPAIAPLAEAVTPVGVAMVSRAMTPVGVACRLELMGMALTPVGVAIVPWDLPLTPSMGSLHNSRKRGHESHLDVQGN